MNYYIAETPPPKWFKPSLLSADCWYYVSTEELYMYSSGWFVLRTGYRKGSIIDRIMIIREQLESVKGNYDYTDSRYRSS